MEYVTDKNECFNNFSGIYSSTHLLALMYTGEMCYRFLMSTKESTDAERVTCNLGIEVLETYIQATQELPELIGWSNEQAKKYLSEMKGR